MMPRGILLREATDKLRLKRIRPGYYRGKGTAMVDGKRVEVEVEVEKMEGWSRGLQWSSRADIVSSDGSSRYSELWNASDTGGNSSYRDAKIEAEGSLALPWKNYPGLGYAFA